jgi:hypothetical protein
VFFRYKNRTSSKAEPNLIKQFKAAAFTPLSQDERVLLEEGVNEFGRDFDTIAEKLLPHRRPEVLYKFYKMIHGTNSIDCTSRF